MLTPHAPNKICYTAKSRTGAHAFAGTARQATTGTGLETDRKLKYYAEDGFEVISVQVSAKGCLAMNIHRLTNTFISRLFAVRMEGLCRQFSLVQTSYSTGNIHSLMSPSEFLQHQNKPSSASTDPSVVYTFYYIIT
jgi:hypothetical protein